MGLRAAITSKEGVWKAAEPAQKSRANTLCHSRLSSPLSLPLPPSSEYHSSHDQFPFIAAPKLASAHTLFRRQLRFLDDWWRPSWSEQPNNACLNAYVLRGEYSNNKNKNDPFLEDSWKIPRSVGSTLLVDYAAKPMAATRRPPAAATLRVKDNPREGARPVAPLQSLMSGWVSEGQTSPLSSSNQHSGGWRSNRQGARNKGFNAWRLRKGTGEEEGGRWSGTGVQILKIYSSSSSSGSSSLLVV